MKSQLLTTLVERGFVKDCTGIDDLDTLAHAGAVTAYVGFDLTAPHLHVGSLIQIMMIRHLLAHGAQVFVVLGGATTRVGDPTGKDAARPKLEEQTIRDNETGIIATLDRLCTIWTEQAGSSRVQALPRLMNNHDWISQIGYLEFLTEIAPHFTVNRMLTMDSVRDRLARQNPMTVLEFNYAMMQAIDFLHLHRTHRCNLQIGGSDQWSNILSGVELVRRVAGNSVYGLTTPLMTNADGMKMGKTADGAVWLRGPTSANDFWQFWRNVEDSKVEEFLALFTMLPMDEVRRLGALEGQEINAAKIMLANGVTGLVYGGNAAKKAAEAALATFVEGHGALDDLIVPADLWGTLSVAELLVRLGIEPSKAAVRRLAKQNGLTLAYEVPGVGNEYCTPDVDEPWSTQIRNHSDVTVRIGKKRRYRLTKAD